MVQIDVKDCIRCVGYFRQHVCECFFDFSRQHCGQLRIPLVSLGVTVEHHVSK